MSKIERFIAVNTRVVVNGKLPAQWYVTTRETVVVDDRPAVCPITNQPVRMVDNNGHRMFFPENLIQTRNVFEPGDIDENVLGKMNPVLFVYDLPDSVGFPNPSGTLRRFAVRLNLSGWIMDSGDVPHAMIGRMIETGCNPHVLKLDRDELKTHVRIAINSMVAEIREKIRGAEKSQRDAERILNRATDETGHSPEAAQNAYLRRATEIANRLAALNSDLALAAARFGINLRVLGLDRLGFTGNAVQSAMAERATQYLAAQRAARAIGTTDGAAIANAMETNAIDPMVVADFVDENGGDGAPLRAAFEPETFRLTDAIDDENHGA